MLALKVCAKYIERYTSRPAITESRIRSYDDKKVVFYYKRHEDGIEVKEELDALNFNRKREKL